MRSDGAQVARLHIAEPAPSQLGVVFGDVLFNWRSALDNLAYQLVLLGGRTPTEREHTGFPILRTQKLWEGRGLKLVKGMRPEHIDVIEGLQPFADRDAPASKALVIVNDENNVDKHRSIHPSLLALGSMTEFARSFRREPIDNEFRMHVDPVGWGRALQDGMEIAHVRLLDPQPDSPPQIIATPSIGLAFGSKGLALKALPALRDHIHQVVGRFATDLPCRSG